MSYIKRWLEENIDNISDEELLESGFDPYEILLMRESFGMKKEETQAQLGPSLFLLYFKVR